MGNQHQDILSSIEDFKKIFGNEYKFLPVATEEELNYFENKFNVKIPYEYRWFLLNIANGIVSEDKRGFKLISKVDFNNFFFKEDEFNPAIPFKWDKKIMCYKYDSDTYPYEFIVNEDLEYFEECTNGQIIISSYGEFLVVNGIEYGNVWVDNFDSMQEVYPDYDLKRNKKRLNFFDWLIKTIENKIEFFTPVIVIDKMEKNMIDLNFSSNDEEWYLEMKFEKLKEFNEVWTDGNISIWINQSNFDKPQVFKKNAINYFNDNQKRY